MKYFYILLTMSLISSCAVTEDAKLEDTSFGKNKWHVIYCSTGDKEKDERLNSQLFFAIKENGKEDMLFFAVKYGGAYTPIFSKENGIFLELTSVEQELRLFQKKNAHPVIAWSGKTESLVYEGTIINLGEVFTEEMIDSNKFYISKIKVWLK